MTLHGKIQNGMVVLDGGTELPDGTPVTVLVDQTDQTHASIASVAERERRKAALAELLALPDENPGDTFSGVDHDQVLYGDRE